MNKDIYILGIESSCDETAAAVVKNGREIKTFTYSASNRAATKPRRPSLKTGAKF